MHKRINITLPAETVRVLDRVAGPGGRSGLINEAVTRYLSKMGRARLRKQLAEGYKRNAERDLAIAREWAPLDDEVWAKYPRG